MNRLTRLYRSFLYRCIRGILNIGMLWLGKKGVGTKMLSHQFSKTKIKSSIKSKPLSKNTKNFAHNNLANIKQ